MEQVHFSALVLKCTDFTVESEEAINDPSYNLINFWLIDLSFAWIWIIKMPGGKAETFREIDRPD